MGDVPSNKEQHLLYPNIHIPRPQTAHKNQLIFDPHTKTKSINPHPKTRNFRLAHKNRVNFDPPHKDQINFDPHAKNQVNFDPPHK